MARSLSLRDCYRHESSSVGIAPSPRQVFVQALSTSGFGHNIRNAQISVGIIEYQAVLPTMKDGFTGRIRKQGLS